MLVVGGLGLHRDGAVPQRREVRPGAGVQAAAQQPTDADTQQPVGHEPAVDDGVDERTRVEHRRRQPVEDGRAHATTSMASVVRVASGMDGRLAFSGRVSTSWWSATYRARNAPSQ